MSARMQIARGAWDEVPDFVEALVKACDAKDASQNTVARKLGVSGTVVSHVIHNKYGAGLDNIERRIREVFMSSDVECPRIGTITAANCLGWKDRAKGLPQNTANPIALQMYHACRRCPKFTGEDAL